MNNSSPYPQLDSTKLQFAPVKSGGISFCNAKLNTKKDFQYEINFTKANFISYLIIFAFFTIFLIIGVNYKLPFLFLGIILFIAALIVTHLVIKILSLPKFNFYTNCCKIGRKEIPFNDIIALQIVEENVRTKKSNYMSYELNIITNNYSRINLMDHGNIKQLTNDAKVLSEALNVPVITIDDYPEQKAKLQEFYQKKQIKGLVIISIVFASLALLMFTLGVVIPCVKSLEAKNWVEVDAQVLESFVRTHTNKKQKKSYSLNLTAQYIYNNKVYICKKYSYLDSSSKRELNKIVKANPVGKKIKCYVNSNNPKDSIISKAISIREALSLGCVSCVFFIISCLLFFFRKKLASGKMNLSKTKKLSLFGRKTTK